MKKNTLRVLCSLLKTDLVYESSDGTLEAFFENTADSPLFSDPGVRKGLKDALLLQGEACLLEDPPGWFFAGLKADKGFVWIGPMCHGKPERARLTALYRRYGMSAEHFRTLPSFTFPEMQNVILLLTAILENRDPDPREHMILFRDDELSEDRNGREQALGLLRKEEEDDDKAWRHSYHEEQLLMNAIRDGRTKDAVLLAENMDRDSGRLGVDNYQHHRNLAMIGIALCSRAAIEGGLPPADAYTRSGYYIQKCDTAGNTAQLLYYRNCAIREFADEIHRRRNAKPVSNYVETCKNYIHRHFREKIYLNTLAEELGLSPAYLSRLFKKETGQCLQDYINEVRVERAGNLLRYSDFSLGEIAQYVHFPSQSYFGKVFREKRGMTPRAWREKYQVAEFRGSVRTVPSSQAP